MVNEQPTQCPDCNEWTCYDYNGMQVCSECYHRAIEEMELEEYKKDQERQAEEEALIEWARSLVQGMRMPDETEKG